MTTEPFKEEASAFRGELTRTAFLIEPGLGYEEWAEMGHGLIAMAQASMWWVGDWLLYGEHAYGEKYAQAVEATGYALSTLKNAQWVADRFPPDERREELSHSHHRAVASLEKSSRETLLQRAVDEGMQVGEVVGRVKAIKAAEKDAERPKNSPVEVIVPSAPRTVGEAVEKAIAVLEQAHEREDWSLVKQATEILVASRGLVGL
jgi:hypothetical protein